MKRFILRRILALIPVGFLVTFMVFMLMHIIPGDPVIALLGDQAAPETVAVLRHQLGLDRPVLVQYGTWLWHLLHGDMGRSFHNYDTVAHLVMERYPTTLELAVLGILTAVLIGIPLGVVSGAFQNSKTDGAVTVLSVTGISLPSFWLGILLIWVFSVKLGWLPSVGFVPLKTSLVQNLKTMVLPVTTLAVAQAAVIARMTRSGLIQVLRLDYIRTARAKGVHGRTVVLRHGMRNALIPVVTVVGLQVGHLLGGAVIVESIFGLPGLGRLIVDSIYNRDFLVVQGTVLFLAFSFLGVNLAVDLLYAYLDPRIRYS
jgi:peptide/nickel transport system permease protein